MKLYELRLDGVKKCYDEFKILKDIHQLEVGRWVVRVWESNSLESGRGPWGWDDVELGYVCDEGVEEHSIRREIHVHQRHVYDNLDCVNHAPEQRQRSRQSYIKVKPKSTQSYCLHCLFDRLLVGDQELSQS